MEQSTAMATNASGASPPSATKLAEQSNKLAVSALDASPRASILVAMWNISNFNSIPEKQEMAR